MASQVVFVFLLSTLLLLCHANADVYTVGGDEGWTTANNYLRWSQGYNFTVGDVLLFRYVKGQHDVAEVTEETFRSCDTGPGAVKKYESGSDRVTLEEARKYWFVCSISGHCLGGMKLSVDVRTGQGGVGPGSGSETTPPGGGGSANGAAGRWGSRWTRIIFGTLVVLILWF